MIKYINEMCEKYKCDIQLLVMLLLQLVIDMKATIRRKYIETHA